MRLFVTELAEADLDALVMYVADESIQNALAIDSRIRDRMRMLADHPELGPVGRMPNTRELMIARDRCVVVYRLEGNFVVILRIIHGVQEWPLEIC